MHRAIDDLTDILEKQTANYLRLKELILEKRKAIVANDLKELSRITSQIEMVIASNNALEMGRIGLAKKLANELKLSPDKTTLRAIARRLGSPLSEKLMDVQRRASDAIKEVQRQNRINAEMLRYCANLMDSVVRRLVEGEPDPVTYGNTGMATRRAASASLLDQHI